MIRMTREEILNKLTNEEADTVRQWVQNGCWEQLHEYVKDRLSLMDNAMLENYYKQVFGAAPPKGPLVERH